MTVNPGPRARRTAQNTQYTYNLNRRIHTVHTYPVLSPQGATILLYGHEGGVTVVWRGGRPFKPQVVQDAAHGRQNGNPPADSVMIIDSDDEDEAANGVSSGLDVPQFEDDADDESPCPPITQTLDLAFESAVLHIATLPMTPCAADEAAWGGAEIFKEKLVFTIACASREAFLLTLPLVPPSPLSKSRADLQQDLLAGKAGNGKWGETVVLLNGQEKHSDGLAMTLVKGRTADSNSSSDRSRSASQAAARVIVAAHTREACGTLRLWDVPLDGSRKGDRTEPFQTEYLPKPLSSISFNPAQTTQLLCNASPDAVRIYDYAVASMPPDDSEGPFPSQGSWLVSLYPPYTRGTSSRKPILASAWIAHGRAILALLADGQWGIWDIDGASPQASHKYAKADKSVRTADTLTEFDVTGYVEGASPLRNPAAQRTSDISSNFVPMTPHTRRDAMATSMGPEHLSSVKGGLTVTPLPSSATTAADESVVLWIGGADHVFIIPGVMKFWDAQIRRGVGGGVNLFSGAQPTRMIRLSDLGAGLMGERCIGVDAIVRFDDIADSGAQGLPVEVLVCGESRLVVLQESDQSVGARIGGVVGRRKRLSDKPRETSAIIVHPRPEQPSSISYNLSVGPRRQASRGRVTGLFDPAEKAPDAMAPEEASPMPARPASGLDFMSRISAAADVEQQEEDDERDVEAEMLDVMEIDRELDALHDDRGRGRKKVLFNS